MRDISRRKVWALVAILLLIGCSSDNGTDNTGQKKKDTGDEGTLPPEMLEGTSEVLLLDDFDDGDDLNEIGGSWSTYDDRESGGESEVWPPSWDDGGVFEGDEPGYGDPGRAAHLVGETGDILGFDYLALITDLGQDVICPLAKPTDIDLNAYDGVQFMAKGEIAGGTLLFRIFHTKDGEEDNCEKGYPETLTDWSDYQIGFETELTEEWSLVRIPFEDLRQPDWATLLVSIEEVLTHAKNFTWHYEKAGGEVDLWMDNVSLYKSAASTEPDTPDMEIHAPEPPDDAVIESIDIESPLQALAETSLNRGYNLTNWLEQEDFDGFGEYDEAFVEHLAENGFEALRLPIDLDRYIENRIAYFEGEADLTVDPTLFEILDAFESWTSAHDLSLTIDYHQYDSSMDLEDPLDVAAAVELWSAVAEHFEDHPREDLFFELLNEPEQSGGVSAVSQDTWTAVAEELIDAIRAHDTERVIIFGDVNWYGISALTSRTPFSDPRMIYAVHFYDPFIFTLQGASWTDNMGSVHDVPYPYTEERWSEYYRDLGFDPEVQPDWVIYKANNYYKEGNKPSVRNALIEAKKWAVEHQVPVICNEFGVLDRTSRMEDRLRYYADVVDVFDELEIPWQHWFQIMSRETGEIDPELKAAFGLTSDPAR